MPLLTADFLIRRIRLLTNDQLDGVLVSQLLDQSFRELTQVGKWAVLKFDGVLTTIPQRHDGTLTATHGSPTMTGTGTTFSLVDTGSYIHMDTDTPYIVESVTGQTLTLTSPYVGATGTGKAYSVTKAIYPLDADIDCLLSIGGPQWPITEQSQSWLDATDLTRNCQGEPYRYAFRQLNAVGTWQIELWPAPTESFRLPYLGLKTGGVPSRSTPIHTDFYDYLVKRTAASACQTLVAKTKEAHWSQMYMAYMAEAERARIELKRRNRRRFGLDQDQWPHNLEADPQLDLHGAVGIPT